MFVLCPRTNDCHSKQSPRNPDVVSIWERPQRPPRRTLPIPRARAPCGAVLLRRLGHHRDPRRLPQGRRPLRRPLPRRGGHRCASFPIPSLPSLPPHGYHSHGGVQTATQDIMDPLLCSRSKHSTLTSFPSRFPPLRFHRTDFVPLELSFVPIIIMGRDLS